MKNIKTLSSFDFTQLLTELRNFFGKNYSCKDLMIAFAYGMAGNPIPTLKLEEAVFYLIGERIQEQIDQVKKDKDKLAEQARMIKKSDDINRYVN